MKAFLRITDFVGCSLLYGVCYNELIISALKTPEALKEFFSEDSVDLEIRYSQVTYEGE